MTKLDRRETFIGEPRRVWLSGLLLVLTLTPRLALAQTPARSFAELQSLLKAGDEVRVTDAAGRTSHGRVVDVSRGTLGLTVDGRRRDVSEATVREVKRRHPDLWWDGLLIGAVVGTVVGGVVKGRNCGSTDCGEGGLVDPGFYVIGAAIGAGAGALVDRALRRFDTVFVGPVQSNPPRLSLMLILSRDAKGLQWSVRF